MAQQLWHNLFGDERRAPFIVIEGIDGAGTTTQSQLLLERLNAYLSEWQGQKTAILTHEPSTGPVGMILRQMMSGRLLQERYDAQTNTFAMGPMDRESLALLFAADRMDHVKGEVWPALCGNRPVVSDRYVASSLAYQGDVEAGEGGVERVDYEWVWELNSRALQPDVTFFLDIGLETSLSRLDQRDAKQEIYETREKLERLIVRYTEVSAFLESQGHHVMRIDGALSVAQIHEMIWAEVKRLLR